MPAPKFVLTGDYITSVITAKLLLHSIPSSKVSIHVSKVFRPVSQSLQGFKLVPSYNFKWFRNSWSARDMLALYATSRDFRTPLIFSDPNVNHILACTKSGASMQNVPSLLDAFRYALPSIWEVLKPANRHVLEHEESLYDFVKRRFGTSFTARFVQPFSNSFLGGTDPTSVSAASCLPRLWFGEKRFGSVLLSCLFDGMFFKSSSTSLHVSESLRHASLAGGRYFTLDLATFVDHLIFSMKLEFPDSFELLNYSDGSSDDIPFLANSSDSVIVCGSDALENISKSMMSYDFPIETVQSLSERRNIRICSLAFDSNVVSHHKNHSSFWCNSSSTKSHVLGGFFDSLLFPGHFCDNDKTILTVYTSFDDYEENNEVLSRKQVFEFLQNSLHIQEIPKIVHAVLEPVPVMSLGHTRALSILNNWRLERFPKLQFIGQGFYASSVSEIISDCVELVNSLKNRFEFYPSIENELPWESSTRNGFGLGGVLWRGHRCRVK